jgi:hypothetical protein
MTVQTPPAPASTPTGRFEPCEECGAPMDPQQRYCVSCTARRGNGANPASRYFAAMSRKVRRPPVVVNKGGSGSRAAAVSFFALLPIAVAIGVVVGRAGSGEDNSAIIDALRQQGSSSASAGQVAGSPVGAGGKKSALAKKNAKQPSKGAGKVVAKTQYGTVHKVTGYKPSKQAEDEGKKLVENNVEQTGSGYIEAQTNLPDVTVVGGNPNEAPPVPTGKGQP